MANRNRFPRRPHATIHEFNGTTDREAKRNRDQRRSKIENRELREEIHAVR